MNCNNFSTDHLNDLPTTDYKSLNNINLLSCFEGLVRSERKITHQVLLCINEIEKRKLHLDKGFTGLFDYLVQSFGYSASAAMRRIDGARLLKELPEVAEKFENGSLNLSQATQLQRAAREFKKIKSTPITSAEKRELVLKIENLNQRDTEKTIAATLDLPIVPLQKETFHKDQSVTLTITLTQEQLQILEQAQNMISHSVPNKNWADTFTYLAKKEVARRTTSRTLKTSTTVAVLTEDSTATKTLPVAVAPQKVERRQKCKSRLNNQTINTALHSIRLHRRAIPARIRKKLLHPTARCEHKDPNGKICANSRFLQIDHIKSWSRGGAHTIDNFQVLCGAHNRFKYSNESL